MTDPSPPTSRTPRRWMLRTALRPLVLMLPVLVPSWRFFDAVAPSPRIHFRLLSDASPHSAVLQDWYEFRPRAAHLPVRTLFKRLLGNAAWNEQLFMTSCAERILEHHTWHSEREILERIADHLRATLTQDCQLQFRLLVIERKGNELHSSEQFRSSLYALAAKPAA